MSPQSARTSRIAYIVLALVCLTCYCGYQTGKHMAQRDNAVASAS